MASPRISHATFADLAALGDDARVEIIHGSLVERAAPAFEHSRSQLRFGKSLGSFDGGPEDDGPGGWWLGSEVDIEYEPHELFCHDLAGWRRERVPECPMGRPVRIRPDWVCELLSPSNERRDLHDKLHVLHAAGVPHYWIGHPAKQTLVVHRWAPGGYEIALTAKAGDVVRAEPFDAIQLSIRKLFGA